MPYKPREGIIQISEDLQKSFQETIDKMLEPFRSLWGPPPKKIRRQRAALKREEVKRKILRRGDSHPGDLSRQQWIDKFKTNGSTYDRAVRELRETPPKKSEF
jgi:hypothetical protein